MDDDDATIERIKAQHLAQEQERDDEYLLAERELMAELAKAAS